MRVLITGGAGFIGHHVIDHLLANTEWEIVSLDRLDTSGSLNRLADSSIWRTNRKRTTIVWHDLKAPVSRQTERRIGPVDVVLHLAASSHVDRSIEDPVSFVQDNALGTAHALELARRQSHLHRFLYFSTDEVFGPAPPGVWHAEWGHYHSRNPYAASKAAGEELSLAYENTYRLPVIVTHCMNVFGERQHPEKFVPSTIRKLLAYDTLVIHADPTCTTPGSRFYIHARNVAAAIVFLLEHAQTGEKYNIVGEREVNNLEMAQHIAALVERPLKYELVDFHSSRPGHDLRYALDGTRMRDMGWKLPVDFEQSLGRTVRWFVAHQDWL